MAGAIDKYVALAVRERVNGCNVSARTSTVVNAFPSVTGFTQILRVLFGPFPLGHACHVVSRRNMT
jgi:hypothetical protein